MKLFLLPSGNQTCSKFLIKNYNQKISPFAHLVWNFRIPFTSWWLQQSAPNIEKNVRLEKKAHFDRWFTDLWQRFLGFKPVGKEKLETWKYVGISIFLGGHTNSWMVYFMENPTKLDDLGVPPSPRSCWVPPPSPRVWPAWEVEYTGNMWGL